MSSIFAKKKEDVLFVNLIIPEYIQYRKEQRLDSPAS